MSGQHRTNVKSGSFRSTATQEATTHRPGRLHSPGALDDRARRRTILDAALKTFSVHGFSGGSIAKVARNHGVSPALIHYYFRNKNELWRAALDYGLGDVVRELTERLDDLADLDSLSRLKFFIRRYITIVSERPEVFDIITREGETTGPRLAWLTRQHLTPLYNLWTSLIEAAQAEGKIKATIPPYHLFQIIAGASYQFMASRVRMQEVYGIDVSTRELRDRHTNAVLDVLFAGMLTSPVESRSSENA
jgi:TetR/AcrR family transcriptional regulator